MCELAELVQRAGTIVNEVLTDLGLVFLLEGVEIVLVGVVIFIVLLLSNLFHYLSWRIVEVSYSSLRVNSFTLVFGPGLLIRLRA